MNITKNLCKKAFDWASNPRNTWMGIVWRALVALAFMLALSPLLFAEQLLREMFRPRTAYERGYDDGCANRQFDDHSDWYYTLSSKDENPSRGY